MTRIHIGHDISLIEEGVDEDSARVYVEANNGEVSITCAWGDAWAGYAAMYNGSMDAADLLARAIAADLLARAIAADLLARAIAADPVGVLAWMNYDCAGWFKPAN